MSTSFTARPTRHHIHNSMNDDAPVLCKCKPPQPAVLLQVKKEGPNKGRYFYKCGASLDESKKCKLFEWQDGVKTSSQSQSSSQPSSGTSFPSGVGNRLTAPPTPATPQKRPQPNAYTTPSKTPQRAADLFDDDDEMVFDEPHRGPDDDELEILNSGEAPESPSKKVKTFSSFGGATSSSSSSTAPTTPVRPPNAVASSSTSTLGTPSRDEDFLARQQALFSRSPTKTPSSSSSPLKMSGTPGAEEVELAKTFERLVDAKRLEVAELEVLAGHARKLDRRLVASEKKIEFQRGQIERMKEEKKQSDAKLQTLMRQHQEMEKQLAKARSGSN